MWWVRWLAPNIYVLAPGILKMVHKVRLKMFLLKMVDYSMSPKIFVSAPVPFWPLWALLGLELGWTGLGLGLGGLGTQGLGTRA